MRLAVRMRFGFEERNALQISGQKWITVLRVQGFFDGAK